MNNLDAIDAAAEREAAALDWMSENLDAKPHPSAMLLRQLVPITRNCRYARLKNTVALEIVARAMKAWNPVTGTPLRLPKRILHRYEATKLDLVRRAKRRVERRARLKRLRLMRQEWLPARDAMQLGDLRQRTLCKKTRAGIIRRRRDGQRVLINRDDLIRYAQSKLAHPRTSRRTRRLRIPRVERSQVSTQRGAA
jgi:hypothetical protein